MAKNIFTTTQVGKICGVTQQTVIKWVDSGQLEGFRLPNSRDRRVTKAALLKFMKEHNIPSDVLDESSKTRILVVDDEGTILKFMEAVFKDDKGIELRLVGRGFDAGVVSAYKPHIIFLDIMLPDIDGRHVCKLIRDSVAGKDIAIIAISGYSATLDESELMAAGFDYFLPKPFDRETVQRIVEKYMPKK